MKKLLVSAAAAAVAGLFLSLAASPASAWTCQERAQACANLGGGQACFAKGRCQGGIYTAPSGRTWKVNGIKHGSRVGKNKNR